MTQLWNLPNWPAFYWNNSDLMDLLVSARFEQGRLLSLPSDFVHSYEVSEIKKHMYADLTNKLLTQERLHGWQASLFPTGYSGIKKIKVADFRTKELHGRASLPYNNLPEEVDKFLHWWQEPPVGLDPVLRSGIAFFWFLLISPYEAGNFDLACSLAELALQEQEQTLGRLYDVSLQLEENKTEILKLTDQLVTRNGNITDWLKFYLSQYLIAVQSSYAIADKAQSINLFWKKTATFDLNARQRKFLNHFFFEGGTINNKTYVSICKTSRESAKRDLIHLFKLGLLRRGNKNGRSFHYLLEN